MVCDAYAAIPLYRCDTLKYFLKENKPALRNLKRFLILLFGNPLQTFRGNLEINMKQGALNWLTNKKSKYPR